MSLVSLSNDGLSRNTKFKDRLGAKLFERLIPVYKCVRLKFFGGECKLRLVAWKARPSVRIGRVRGMDFVSEIFVSPEFVFVRYMVQIRVELFESFDFVPSIPSTGRTRIPPKPIRIFGSVQLTVQLTDDNFPWLI